MRHDDAGWRAKSPCLFNQLTHAVSRQLGQVHSKSHEPSPATPDFFIGIRLGGGDGPSGGFVETDGQGYASLLQPNEALSGNLEGGYALRCAHGWAFCHFGKGHSVGPNLIESDHEQDFSQTRTAMGEITGPRRALQRPWLPRDRPGLPARRCNEMARKRKALTRLPRRISRPGCRASSPCRRGCPGCRCRGRP